MYGGADDGPPDKPGASSSRVPESLRMFLPVLTAANIALLLCAHLMQGASTEVTGKAPFGLLVPHTASSDNLISAAGRLAGASAWASVAIVVGLSGLWPYVKLLSTLATVWSVDAGTMSRARGRRLLRIVEVAGKYSFADVFLICFNFVIFDISSGTYSIMVAFTLEIHLWMQLHLASVALIVAVTFSTFLTHWACFSLSGKDEEDDLRMPLLAQPREDPARQPDGRHSSGWVYAMAVATALSGCVLLIMGTFLPMVKVERGGFLGSLIQPSEEKDLDLSILSITQQMLHAGGVYNGIMTAFFVGLTIVAPLLEFLFLAADAVACHGKSAAQQSRWTSLGAEWVHSFGCIDVLLIVAAVLVCELHTVVEFNIGDECAPFESIMSNKAILDLAGLGFAASSECFTTGPSLRAGWGVLLCVVAARFFAWRLNDSIRTGAKAQ